MKTINCPNCNKDFECSTRKFNFNTKNNFQIFCSTKCYLENKKRTTKCNCATCGKEIVVANSRIRNSKTGNVYCNKTCSTINNNKLFKKWENHPSYKNGNSRYRFIKLNNTKNPCCERCKNDDIRVLEVHHKDKNRKNNKLDNLEILCANCHKIEHYESMV